MATRGRNDVELGIGVKADTTDLEKLRTEFDQATAATKEFARADSAARADSSESKRALDGQREALARLRLDYRAGKIDAEAFKMQELALQAAILDARVAVRAKTETLQAATTAVRIASAQEKALADRMREATTATRQQGDATRGVTGDLQALHGQLRTIQQLAGAALGGQLLGGIAGDVAKTADAYANLSARIKLITGDGEAFKTVLQGVFEIAQRTGSEVATVGDLFTKVAQAAKQLGATNQQTLALVETITQATQLSDVSAESAAAAMVQFSQAMASGVLRGDEFNSVMEQAPRLAKALADGLGVTTGELRKLAEAGTLSSQTVISALQGQGAALRAEFDQLPPTIGRAITNLSSAWTQYVGEVDKATGASAAIAGALNNLSKNLDTVANVLFSVGEARCRVSGIEARTDLGRHRHLRAHRNCRPSRLRRRTERSDRRHSRHRGRR